MLFLKNILFHQITFDNFQNYRSGGEVGLLCDPLIDGRQKTKSGLSDTFFNFHTLMKASFHRS
jgi:hypothetical protein